MKANAFIVEMVNDLNTKSFDHKRNKSIFIKECTIDRYRNLAKFLSKPNKLSDYL